MEKPKVFSPFALADKNFFSFENADEKPKPTLRPSSVPKTVFNNSTGSLDSSSSSHSSNASSSSSPSPGVCSQSTGSLSSTPPSNEVGKTSLEQIRKKLQKENWDLKKKNDAKDSQIKWLTEQVSSLENSLQVNDKKTQNTLQLAILWIIEIMESFLFVCFPYEDDSQKQKRRKWKKKIMKRLNFTNVNMHTFEQLITLPIYLSTTTTSEEGEEQNSSDSNHHPNSNNHHSRNQLSIVRRNFSPLEVKTEAEISKLLFLIIQKAKKNQSKFLELFKTNIISHSNDNNYITESTPLYSDHHYRSQSHSPYRSYYHSSNPPSRYYVDEDDTSSGNNNHHHHHHNNNNNNNIYINKEKYIKLQEKEKKHKETIDALKRKNAVLSQSLSAIEEENYQNQQTIQHYNSQLEKLKSETNEIHQFYQSLKLDYEKLANDYNTLSLEKNTLVEYIMTYKDQQKQYEDLIRHSSLQINSLTQEKDLLLLKLAQLSTSPTATSSSPSLSLRKNNSQHTSSKSRSTATTTTTLDDGVNDVDEDESDSDIESSENKENRFNDHNYDNKYDDEDEMMQNNERQRTKKRKENRKVRTREINNNVNMKEEKQQANNFEILLLENAKLNQEVAVFKSSIEILQQQNSTIQNKLDVVSDNNRKMMNDIADFRTSTNELSHEVLKLNSENNQLNSEIDDLSQQFENLSQEHQKLLNENQALRSNNHELKEEIKNLKSTNISLNSEITKLTYESDNKANGWRTRCEKLESQIRNLKLFIEREVLKWESMIQNHFPNTKGANFEFVQ